MIRLNSNDDIKLKDYWEDWEKADVFREQSMTYRGFEYYSSPTFPILLGEVFHQYKPDFIIHGQAWKLGTTAMIACCSQDFKPEILAIVDKGNAKKYSISKLVLRYCSESFAENTNFFFADMNQQQFDLLPHRKSFGKTMIIGSNCWGDFYDKFLDSILKRSDETLLMVQHFGKDGESKNYIKNLKSKYKFIDLKINVCPHYSTWYENHILYCQNIN